MSLNNYEYIKFLGKGSFGRVNLVRKKNDKQIYALKQVNLINCPPNEIEAALNEIRLLASLNHPNIIGYIDSFYDNPSNTLNIVMEFADGGDLAKKIDYNKKSRCLFDESIIWEYLIQLLNGIEYLHSQQIMHRDLKCANIFVMKNGILKIGDMNVSKLSKQNYARTKTGTPYYLAPEVWDDRPYDYKCDLWSLGCIIYELCTTLPPFRGTNFKELYNNIKSGKFNPISREYSQDLKNIINMMLITNPNKRYSAKDLLSTTIIQNRMKNRESFNHNQKQKCILLKTIKMPKNLKDINKYLPHERHQMGENDPFETMKKTIKLMANKEQNANNINNNINIQPLNNYNRELANQRKNNPNNIINNNQNENNMNNNHFNNQNENNKNNQLYNNHSNNQNENIIKPVIIKKEENIRKEYNIFNNKIQNSDSKNQNNNIKNNNNINQQQQKIPIKSIKIKNKDTSKNNESNQNNQNNQSKQMGAETRKRKEKEKFAQIKNEFKIRPQSNRLVKNKNAQKQQKLNDPKQRQPSADQNKMYNKNNNNSNNNFPNNNKYNNNKNNINYNHNNINLNKNNNNINNKNRQRPQSHCGGRVAIRSNNQPKINNMHYNNNPPIKKYDIKNHNYNFQGQNFDMKPYKRGNKANYCKLDVNQYKENNKLKFNNYLHNGGKNYNNNININQINAHRQRVNPLFKQNNHIHRDGRYKK